MVGPENERLRLEDALEEHRGLVVFALCGQREREVRLGGESELVVCAERDGACDGDYAVQLLGLGVFALVTEGGGEFAHANQSRLVRFPARPQAHGEDLTVDGLGLGERAHAADREGAVVQGALTLGVERLWSDACEPRFGERHAQRAREALATRLALVPRQLAAVRQLRVDCAEHALRVHHGARAAARTPLPL